MVMIMVYGVQGLGLQGLGPSAFRVQGLGVQGVGLRGLGFRVKGLESRVLGSRRRVLGLLIMLWGSGSRVCGFTGHGCGRRFAEEHQNMSRNSTIPDFRLF